MVFKLNKNDTHLLGLIAEYRILTIDQVAILVERTTRSTRRRLADLADADLIDIDRYAYDGRLGRPEGIVSLTPRGLRALREVQGMDTAVVSGEVGAVQVRQLGHDIFVNWVRLHLCHAARLIPRLRIHFEVPAVALIQVQDDRRGHGRARRAGQTDFGLIPDGADQEAGKTVLFFLEVDMGTESLASANPATCSVLQKIQAYQSIFRSGAYKRYEGAWDCNLNGFRVLFVANSHVRLVGLCRLVQEVPPSDFVWLTDQDRLFEQGIGADIWLRGGRFDDRPQSILGHTLARPTPIPLPSDSRIVHPSSAASLSASGGDVAFLATPVRGRASTGNAP
jgi:hypothetical protein